MVACGGLWGGCAVFCTGRASPRCLPTPLQVVPHAFVGTKEIVALHGKQTVRRSGAREGGKGCTAGGWVAPWGKLRGWAGP